ncbi:hypothetical protein N7478_008397 [Penicillium angulare]|uniref:uncharacterized protein n=1 Tax=Penicillium angulare TaxID=116970 RepID=UPI00254183AE|nr:uncharacterized protein N7478_008397 [Penicillium angulare]KAJ5273272.1 hypothetical protein N7478_008397 [Penicillium angulare]
MEFVAVAVAGLVGSFCSTLSPTTELAWVNRLCSRGDIASELGSFLSPNANIHFPRSEGFLESTNRWSTLGTPNISVVVEVANENDVAETIKYANTHSLPFLAVNGGHGAISSLEAVNNGIQIWLNQLNSISIAKDGSTATIGGGAPSKHITETLWAENKQTVTGICECTSLIGPGLGGGHGALQANYRLVADQFVSLDMVLANGTLITVDENSDLWWGMKGAGHNFGVVTSITSKICDVPHNGLWSYTNFIFTHDKVEVLYETINEMLLPDQPQDIISFSFFTNIPAIDPENSVVIFFILREGKEAVGSEYTDPFTNLAKWLRMEETSPPCQKEGNTQLRFPVDLQEFNPTAQHAAFDLFSKTANEAPALAASLFLLEGYSIQGVKVIPADSTAVPNRDANLLISSYLVYKPDGEGLDTKAWDLGENMRQILFKGSGQEHMYSYVNYAAGNEGPRSWYGYEPWRLEKLRALKEKYDPEHRFSFYAPFD